MSATPSSPAQPGSAPAVEWQRMHSILESSRTVAVVGLSAKPDRAGHTVPAYLHRQGYRIIPVNPNLPEALGEKAYPSLLEVPDPVDVVLIFRRSDEVPPIVEEAIRIGAKAVWMQLGIFHEQAAARAEQAGLQVVMDTCMGTTHRMMRARGEL